MEELHSGKLNSLFKRWELCIVTTRQETTIKTDDDREKEKKKKNIERTVSNRSIMWRIGGAETLGDAVWDWY
jgi:hypothetical protein